MYPKLQFEHWQVSVNFTSLVQMMEKDAKGAITNFYKASVLFPLDCAN
jgi:hypothetical protein